jgi:hypothetical protein
MREKIEKTRKTLPCKLTESELRDRMVSEHEMLEAIDRHEEHIRQVKAELKGELERLEGELARLKRIISTKQEPREVDVEIEADFALGVAYETRYDTMETSNRPLTESEKSKAQRELWSPPEKATGDVESDDDDSEEDDQVDDEGPAVCRPPTDTEAAELARTEPQYVKPVLPDPRLHYQDGDSRVREVHAFSTTAHCDAVSKFEGHEPALQKTVIDQLGYQRKKLARIEELVTNLDHDRNIGAVVWARQKLQDEQASLVGTGGVVKRVGVATAIEGALAFVEEVKKGLVSRVPA